MERRTAMLIIGCGNLHRGDDAAGILAAEKLRALGIKAEICTGGFWLLMEMWTGADDVLVIDAVVTGAPVGTTHEWDELRPINFVRDSGSTHGLGIAEAVALARELSRLPARLRVFGIEGCSFETGSTVSPAVEKAITEVVNRIAGEVQREKAS